MSFGFTNRGSASSKQIDTAFAEEDKAGAGTLDAVGVHEALLAASATAAGAAAAPVAGGAADATDKELPAARGCAAGGGAL